jgi:hypothetical protein
MSALPLSFDRLAAIESSFHVNGPWRGGFHLDGHHVRCELDSDQWFRLSAPAAGNERDLLNNQYSVPLPLKIVPGPTLVAEMPLTDTLESTFVMLRHTLRRGFTLAGPPEPQSLFDGNGERDANARLEPILEESAFTWTRDSGLLSTRVGSVTIVASACDTAAVLRAGAIRVRSSLDPCSRALAHFVLAANARLRFVRHTLVADTLVAEAALPAVMLTPSLVNRAVGAISTSFHMTKRACAALADSKVAGEYLEFHTYRGTNSHADTHH